MDISIQLAAAITLRCWPLARSARSPELRTQLAGHYNRQRDRVAAGITDSVDGAIGPDDARHLASIIIGTANGLLI